MEKEYTKEEILSRSVEGSEQFTKRNWRNIQTDTSQLKWVSCLESAPDRNAAVVMFAKWLDKEVLEQLQSERNAWQINAVLDMSHLLVQDLYRWAQIAGNNLWDSELLQKAQVARQTNDRACVLDCVANMSRAWRLMLVRQESAEAAFWQATIEERIADKKTNLE
jgi:hypothetical protein